MNEEIFEMEMEGIEGFLRGFKRSFNNSYPTGFRKTTKQSQLL